MSKCGKCCYGVMTMPNKMFCSVQNCFCEEVFDCEDYEPIVKHQTNADRIRNMTDEELAEFIGRCVDHEFHIECVCFLNQFGYCQYPTRGCDENALEWLKEECVE